MHAAARLAVPRNQASRFIRCPQGAARGPAARQGGCGRPRFGAQAAGPDRGETAASHRGTACGSPKCRPGRIYDSRFNPQQLRNVTHSCDRAARVLGYTRVIEFRDSMARFRQWYVATRGMAEESWPQIRECSRREGGCLSRHRDRPLPDRGHPQGPSLLGFDQMSLIARQPGVPREQCRSNT